MPLTPGTGETLVTVSGSITAGTGETLVTGSGTPTAGTGETLASDSCCCGVCNTCNVCPEPPPACIDDTLHVTISGFSAPYTALNGTHTVVRSTAPAAIAVTWTLTDVADAIIIAGGSLVLICPENGATNLPDTSGASTSFSGLSTGSGQPFYLHIILPDAFGSPNTFYAGWRPTAYGSANFVLISGSTTSCVPPVGSLPDFWWNAFGTSLPSAFGAGPSASVTA